MNFLKVIQPGVGRRRGSQPGSQAPGSRMKAGIITVSGLKIKKLDSRYLNNLPRVTWPTVLELRFEPRFKKLILVTTCHHAKSSQYTIFF